MKRTGGGRVTPRDIAARTFEVLQGGGVTEAGLTRKERVERSRGDFEYFCRYYLPHYFSVEPAPFHREMVELIQTQSRVIVAAPRGHAKSTVVSFAAVLHGICHGLFHFVVVFRFPESLATQNVNEIRRELEMNEKIREDFGELVGDEKWAEAEFVTSSGIKVFGRGPDSGVRGIRHGAHRPDLLLFDDVDSDQVAESKVQRDKLDNWYHRAALNVLGPNGRVFMVGTVMHHDSLIARLLKRTDVYVTRRWQAIQDGKPLWPARWPMSALEEKRREIGVRHFATEFMNSPANEEDQIFDTSTFRRYSDADVQDARFESVVAAIDPAIGQRSRNDYTAAAVIGRLEGRYYVLKLRMARLKVQQQVDLCLRLSREFSLRALGVETVAYQDALRQLVLDAARRNNMVVPLRPIKDPADKLSRISRLAPLAEQGRLLFPAVGSTRFSADVDMCFEQFEALGSSANTHDDGPDAIAHAVTLLLGSGGRVRAELC